MGDEQAFKPSALGPQARSRVEAGMRYACCSIQSGQAHEERWTRVRKNDEVSCALSAHRASLPIKAYSSSRVPFTETR
jgi:hypothetical protein